jgi:hypothetical protein
MLRPRAKGLLSRNAAAEVRMRTGLSGFVFEASDYGPHVVGHRPLENVVVGRAKGLPYREKDFSIIWPVGTALHRALQQVRSHSIETESLRESND